MCLTHRCFEALLRLKLLHRALHLLMQEDPGTIVASTCCPPSEHIPLCINVSECCCMHHV